MALVCAAASWSGHARAQSSGSFPEPAAPAAAPRPAAPPPAAPPPAVVTPPPAAPPPSTPPAWSPTPPAVELVPPAPVGVVPSLPQYRPGALDALPPLVPYKKGMPVPPGYRLVDRSSGLVLGGGLTFLAGYLAGLGLAASQSFEKGTGYLAIPVAGPWAAIGARSFKCNVAISINVDSSTVQRELNKCVGQAFDEVTSVIFLTVDGLVQATGAVLFFVGLGSGYQELVRQDLPQASVRMLPEGGAAFSFSGKF